MTQEKLVEGLLSELQSAGFSCEEHLHIGPIDSSLYGSKKVRWFLAIPYHIHCYLFLTPPDVQPDAQYVLGLHSIARGFTDRFRNRRSRYFRWTIPITTTLIFSRSGFTEDAIDAISARQQRYQMGNVNTIMLLDGSKMLVYRLTKTGFNRPLKRVHRLARSLVEGLGFQDVSL